MHRRVLTKADGRKLILYSSRPISDDPIDVPSPPEESATGANPHLRYHPLRGEWVTYAAYRQDRTFLPQDDYNPLEPMRDRSRPTELPAGDHYEVAVFENRFPALSDSAHDAPAAMIVDTLPATGVCEVVVFTQDPGSSLGALPVCHIDLILQVWADRCLELGHRDSVRYVMPFENRGVEVGVTLHHPHGQIYAYPFVPPLLERETRQQADYFMSHHGANLLRDLIAAELKEDRRVIYRGEHAIAWVPVFARYAYEVWIAPIQAVAPSLSSLDSGARQDFARAMKTVLLKYDALWNRPFPYVMVLHQAPTDDRDHPEWQMHMEFYPPYRTPDRLKFLAGSEIGAGMFTSDSLPEEKAAELQKVKVRIE